MNPACLAHRLTEHERQTFNDTGLLQIENVLSPEQVAALTEASDRVYQAKLADGHAPRQALFHPNFLGDDPLFLDMVDYEKVLPKVWGILGWNIYLYHAT